MSMVFLSQLTLNVLIIMMLKYVFLVNYRKIFLEPCHAATVNSWLYCWFFPYIGVRAGATTWIITRTKISSSKNKFCSFLTCDQQWSFLVPSSWLYVEASWIKRNLTSSKVLLLLVCFRYSSSLFDLRVYLTN